MYTHSIVTLHICGAKRKKFERPKAFNTVVFIRVFNVFCFSFLLCIACNNLARFLYEPNTWRRIFCYLLLIWFCHSLCCEYVDVFVSSVNCHHWSFLNVIKVNDELRDECQRILCASRYIPSWSAIDRCAIKCIRCKCSTHIFK